MDERTEPPPDGPIRVVLVREGEQTPGWAHRYLLWALGGVLLLGVVSYLFSSLRSLLIILLIAMFVSFAAEPAVDWLAERGWRRGVATGLVFLGFTAAAVAFIALIGVLVVQQLADLLDRLPGYVDGAISWANDTFGLTLTSEDLVAEIEASTDDLQQLAAELGSQALSITVSVVGLVFQGFTIALFSFYFVADGPRLRRALCSLLPPERQLVVLDTWELAIDKTGGYLYSRLLLAGLSAAAAWAAFEVLDLPSPAALALWLGVMAQFVPVVGTYLAGALPVMLALGNNTPANALAVLAFVVIYQQVENYLLAPRVTARTMQLHPAVAFGAVLVGGSTLGAVGALLALPAAAVVQAFLSASLTTHPVVDSRMTSLAPRARRPEAPLPPPGAVTDRREAAPAGPAPADPASADPAPADPASADPASTGPAPGPAGRTERYEAGGAKRGSVP